MISTMYGIWHLADTKQGQCLCLLLDMRADSSSCNRWVAPDRMCLSTFFLINKEGEQLLGRAGTGN